jgi:hypothetical protein
MHLYQPSPFPSSFPPFLSPPPTLRYIYTELEKEKQVTVLIANGISCGKVRIETLRGIRPPVTLSIPFSEVSKS